MNETETIRGGDATPVYADSSIHGLPPLGLRLGSRRRTITEADVVMFASLTGDWHPQHCDAEWAENSAFGERIAHGLLVLSFSVGLVGLEPARVVALRRLREVVFKRPTRIGDTIRVEAVVDSVRAMQAQTALVDLRWRVVNARDETLMRAVVEVLWRDDSQSAGHHPLRPGHSAEMPPGVYPF